jgi:hypothetical protein
VKLFTATTATWELIEQRHANADARLEVWPITVPTLTARYQK